MTDTQLIEVVNPYDRTRICEVEALSWDALDATLDEAAHLHKANNHPLSVRERCALLLQVANRIEDEKEDYARLMAREGGKPFSDSMVEVERAIDGIRYTAEHTPAFMEGEVVPMQRTAKGEGKLARTVREPIGPVLAYSAFNHPLNLIVHQIVPAIAAGCPVLVKP
ncbi:MAG: aldehyde dehydrogenase, partial [Rickettsiales bacterium]|nr:aldehyde dehydrogenase [Rickettsiales bacterium]